MSTKASAVVVLAQHVRLEADLVQSFGHQALLFKPSISPEEARAVAVAVPIDLKDEEQVLAKVAELRQRYDIRGVFSIFEFWMPLAARIGEALGLPYGLSYQAALNCHNKKLTRRLLQQHGVGSARFRLVRSVEDAHTALAEIGLPVVVKPVDDSGSHQVTRCDTLQEALHAVQAIQHQQTNLIGQRRDPDILIEEFLDGPEFSVESFSAHGQTTVLAVTKKLVTPGAIAVESGHTVPAGLAEADQAAIEQLTIAALAALGVDDAVTHTEVKLTADGPRVIEVNPRPAGDMIPTLVRAVTGYDLHELALHASLGGTLADAPHHQPAAPSATIRFVTADRAGIAALNDPHAILRLPDVHHGHFAVHPGDRVRPTTSSHSRLGSFIVLGTALSTADQIADEVWQQLAFRVEDDPAEQQRPFLVVVDPHAVLYRYLEVAHQKGYRTLVVTADRNNCLHDEQVYNHSLANITVSNIDELVVCDSSSAEAIVAALQPYRDQIAGVVAGHDILVSVAAAVGRALGFDYALPADAQAQHLKTKMKQRLVERGVPTAPFTIARSFEEALAGWERFGGDCIVKMVDYISSMNVFHPTDRAALEHAWDTIVHNRRQVVSPYQLEREVIVEEFIAGRELTAEGYVQGDQAVVLNFCEKMTSDDFVIVGHKIPAHVEPQLAERLRTTASACVQALGVRNSVFHVEMHVRGGQPYVIECAARPPGLHAVELIARAYNGRVDLISVSIDLATGQPVQLQPQTPERYFALLALYAERSGTLEQISGLDELRARGGLVHLKVEVEPGAQVQALTTYREKYGFVVLEGRSAEELQERADWMRAHVHLDVVEQPGALAV